MKMNVKSVFFITLCCLIFCITNAGTGGYIISQDFGIQDVTAPAIKLERYQNSIYYIGFIFKGSWYQAMQFCKYYNMDLVGIESQQENEFLFNQMKNFFGGSSEYWFWTSGTTLSNNHWVWMNTGRPIIYSSWFPNQPDNAGNSEHCIEVRYVYTNSGLKWNDNNCETAQLHVICEAPVSRNVSSIISNICTPVQDVKVL